MAENSDNVACVQYSVGDFSAEKEEISQADKVSRQKVWWGSRPGQVAAVQPLSRNQNSEKAVGPSIQLVQSNPQAVDAVSTQYRESEFQGSWNVTRPQPFSFDRRDSELRAAREQRLEELRQSVESQMELNRRFRANPVRKYRPLVVKQSSRPLTLPRDPFTRSDQ